MISSSSLWFNLKVTGTILIQETCLTSGSSERVSMSTRTTFKERTPFDCELSHSTPRRRRSQFLKRIWGRRAQLSEEGVFTTSYYRKFWRNDNHNKYEMSHTGCFCPAEIKSSSTIMLWNPTDSESAWCSAQLYKLQVKAECDLLLLHCLLCEQLVPPIIAPHAGCPGSTARHGTAQHSTTQFIHFYSALIAFLSHCARTCWLRSWLTSNISSAQQQPLERLYLVVVDLRLGAGCWDGGCRVVTDRQSS